MLKFINKLEEVLAVQTKISLPKTKKKKIKEVEFWDALGYWCRCL